MTIERSGTIPTNYTICTSTTRPAAPLVGRMIYETDTKLFYGFNGSTWDLVEPEAFSLVSWF